MKAILELLWSVLSACVEPIVDYVNQEVSKAYLSGVERLRRVFLSLLFHIFAVVLALAGFLMIHLAVFFLLPLSQQVSSLIMLVVGIFYLTMALVYIVKKSSAKNWTKITGADTLRKL
jgi:hypothetical protein